MTDAELSQTEAASTTSEDRSFEARYGEKVVSRGIATIPALLLRWQHALKLKDKHIVTIATIFSFYTSPHDWPSVSIEKMAAWQGVSWRNVQHAVKELEVLGYLVRSGRDPRHNRSFFFDLSGLLGRLDGLADAEAEIGRVRKEQNEIRARALSELSTTMQANREPNREQKQSLETGNYKQKSKKQKSVVEDANSVLVQTTTSKSTDGLQLVGSGLTSTDGLVAVTGTKR